MRKFMLLVLVLAFAEIVSAAPLSLSYIGMFSTTSDVFTNTFTYNPAEGETLNVRTWSFGGGTNLQEITIQPGGFDPMIWLFSGTGTSAVLIYSNDDIDTNAGLWDSQLVLTGLATGEYTLALTMYYNVPIDREQLLDPVLLGNGWTGNNPTFWSTKNYAVDIWQSSSTGVPEPVTMILIGSGLLGFGLLRNRLPKI